MYNYSELIKLASFLNCVCLVNEPLNKHTTFKIGGSADLFINVASVVALKDILKYINDADIPMFILGNGSNVLVSDDGFRGVVIHLCGDFNNIELIDENTIECGASVSLAKLCMFALERSLSGLEFAWGIPGTCGGAAFMNAGAYGGEMKDVLVSCNHMSKDGADGTYTGENLELSYRKSVYSDLDCVITSIKLRLKKDDTVAIRGRMDEFMGKRKAKQPLEYPSAGSVFKRPKNNFAGYLVEKSGFKGFSVGDAQVSNKHAGFIINTDRATCEDVMSLIKAIQNKVLINDNVNLECELKILGSTD